MDVRLLFEGRRLFEAIGVPPQLFAIFHRLLRPFQARRAGTFFTAVCSIHWHSSLPRLVLTSFPSLAHRAARNFLIVRESAWCLANTVSGVVGMSGWPPRHGSDKQRIGGCGTLRLKKISENKSDNRFSFSGGLLLPCDHDPQKNVRESRRRNETRHSHPRAHPHAPVESLNRRVSIPFNEGGNIDQAITVRRPGWQK
jgi:hypothetical protein